MKKIVLFLLLLMPLIGFGQSIGKFIKNMPTGGTIIGDTLASNSKLNIYQTTAGQTITLASRTATTGGFEVMINNIGTFPFIIGNNGAVVYPSAGAYFRWTGTGVWNMTSNSSIVSFINVKDYGATGNGISNDSVAFSKSILASIATGCKDVYVPFGTYIVTNVIMKSGVRIHGEGEGSVLRGRNASNQYIFTCDSLNNFEFQNLKFLGYNTTVASLTNFNAITNKYQNGIKLINLCTKWNVFNCHFYGFEGFGIYWTNTNLFYITNNYGCMITNSLFEYNYCGMYLGPYAEYSMMTANSFSLNTYGVINVGGNNKYANNSFGGCYNGFYLAAGANDGHGALSSNDFNHCRNGLKCGFVNNGEAITGNNFFSCNIIADSAIGLNFTGNQFGSGDSITMNKVSDIYFASNYSSTVTAFLPVISFTNLLGTVCAINNFSKGGVYWDIKKNGYFFNPQSGYLGLGTNNPTNQLDVVGTIKGTGPVQFNPGIGQSVTINQNQNSYSVIANASSSSFQPAMGLYVAGTPVSTWADNGTITYMASNNATHPMAFFSGGTKNETIFTTGNIKVQTGGTHTDNGYKFDVTGTGRFTSDVTMNHLIGGSATPSVAAGTGAGTGPTISITGTDLSGFVTVTIGTSPAGSNAIIATVTFATAYGSAPIVQVGAGNNASEDLNNPDHFRCVVAGQTNGTTASSFRILSGTSALVAGTTYIFTYRVTQ
jgi:hypothetical protein